MKLLLVLTPLLSLAGCVGIPTVRSLRPLEIATAPYLDLITSTHAGSLMSEGHCVLFRDAATGAHLLPVWPPGSSFNGEAVIFHEPAKADQRIVIAQQFVMSGHEARWADLSSDYAPFQHQCGG